MGMGMMNVHVSLRQSPSNRKFIQLENVSSNLTVADLKKEIVSRAGLESNCPLELVYLCQSMKDDSTLNLLEGGSSTAKVIYARVLKPATKQEAKKITTADQNSLFLAFRAAMTNPNFRHTLQNISKPESMNHLLNVVPGLAEDHIALSMLQDWELLLHFGDAKVVHNLVEKHPALVNAVSRVVANALPGLTTDPAQPSSSSRRSQSGWLARSLGADEDDAMDEGSHQQATRNAPPAAGSAITPAQLAAALEFIQNSTRQSQSNSRPPPRASPSAPSNSGGGLTQEMFNQAMSQALMMSSMRGNPAPAPATATPSGSSSGNRDRRQAEEMQLREQFGRHLPQMRELGITDDGLSLRALQATNGDVQAAVNLVFAGLVDD